MIIFNDKKYAANENEFTESLFSPGATCNGFYKKTKNGYRLFNIQNELIAFIRCSKEPMLMNATKLDSGKIWYSHLMTSTEKYLGLDNLSFYDGFNLARNWTYDNWNNNHE